MIGLCGCQKGKYEKNLYLNVYRCYVQKAKIMQSYKWTKQLGCSNQYNWYCFKMQVNNTGSFSFIIHDFNFVAFVDIKILFRYFHLIYLPLIKMDLPFGNVYLLFYNFTRFNEICDIKQD